MSKSLIPPLPKLIDSGPCVLDTVTAAIVEEDGVQIN